MPDPQPQLIVDRDRCRQTFGPYEREIAPPPLTPELADMLTCIRQAHERLDGMQERLERAKQAVEQQDGKL